MRSKDVTKIDKIFEASLQVIVREGIAGLTMAKIAKRSGLATGTLYIYFKNKEVLINELYEHLRVRSSIRFFHEVNPDETIKSKLRKVWFNYLKNRIEYYEASVFLEQYYRSPYITKEHHRLSEEMKEPVKELIREGQKKGVIRSEYDDEMLFLSMLGFIRELAYEHIAGVYTLNQERMDMAFNLNWKTLEV